MSSVLVQSALVKSIVFSLEATEKMALARSMAGLKRDLEIGLATRKGLQSCYGPQLQDLRGLFTRLQEVPTLVPHVRLLEYLRDSRCAGGPKVKVLDLREAADIVFRAVTFKMEPDLVAGVWASIEDGAEATFLPSHLPKPSATHEFFESLPVSFRRELAKSAVRVNKVRSGGEHNYASSTLDRDARFLRAALMGWGRNSFAKLLVRSGGELVVADATEPKRAEILDLWARVLRWLATTPEVFADDFFKGLLKKPWNRISLKPGEKMSAIRKVIDAVNERSDEAFVITMRSASPTGRGGFLYILTRVTPDPILEALFDRLVSHAVTRQQILHEVGLKRNLFLYNEDAFVTGLYGAIIRINRSTPDSPESNTVVRRLMLLGAFFELLIQLAPLVKRKDLYGALVFRGFSRTDLKALAAQLNERFGTDFQFFQPFRTPLSLRSTTPAVFLHPLMLIDHQVFYPRVGVLRVVDVGRRDIKGVSQLCFVGEVWHPFKKQKVLFPVPVDEVTVRGLRPLSTPVEIAQALLLLHNEQVDSLPKKVSQVVNWYTRMMRRGTANDLAIVLKYLDRWCLENKKDKRADLIFNLRPQVRRLLAQEISVVLHIDESRALAKIDKALV